jgi:hypothetical protein
MAVKSHPVRLGEQERADLKELKTKPEPPTIYQAQAMR